MSRVPTEPSGLPAPAGGGTPPRSPGPRGSKTRQRLMDAARHILKTASPLELSAASVSRIAGTAPPSFYVYFRSTRDLLLALVEESNQELRPLRQHFDLPWPPPRPMEWVDNFIAHFLSLWSKHSPVLAYCNLEADRGDPQFEELRTAGAAPIVHRLAERIATARDCAQGQATADAVFLHIMLERMALANPSLANACIPFTDYTEAARRTLLAAVLPEARAPMTEAETSA